MMKMTTKLSKENEQTNVYKIKICLKQTFIPVAMQKTLPQ